MGVWPGANFVTFPDGGRWFLKYGDRRKVAADLKVGCHSHFADAIRLFLRLSKPVAAKG